MKYRDIRIQNIEILPSTTSTIHNFRWLKDMDLQIVQFRVLT